MPIEHFLFQGEPVAAPRMTQRDKWQQRPCVRKYRAFCDGLRKACGRSDKFDRAPVRVDWIAYFSIPKTWTEAGQMKGMGKYHQAKPDLDNVAKAIADALFAEDCAIAAGSFEKRWDDGDGPRVEITFYWE